MPAAPPNTARPSVAGPSERRVTRRIDDEDIRPYIISGELGKGSFAIVYKGFNQVCAYALCRACVCTE
jgi:serine/threonine-protein kinase ULK2